MTVVVDEHGVLRVVWCGSGVVWYDVGLVWYNAGVARCGIMSLWNEVLWCRGGMV